MHEYLPRYVSIASPHTVIPILLLETHPHVIYTSPNSSQIFNGPATANYDEDLGVLFLDDWSHKSVFSLWYTARQGAPPALENGLINGTNTYDCGSSGDSTCTGTLGAKYETAFQPGKKYLIRVVNVATDGHFQFSIDGHKLTVIATDLVPIKPYVTDSVLISIGQRQ